MFPRQIVIEALVVEINTKKAQDLGFNYNLVDKKAVTNFDPQNGLNSTFRSNESSYFDIQPKFQGNYYTDSSTGLATPFKPNVWTRTVPLGFTATLDAFISDGTLMCRRPFWYWTQTSDKIGTVSL